MFAHRISVAFLMMEAAILLPAADLVRRFWFRLGAAGVSGGRQVTPSAKQEQVPVLASTRRAFYWLKRLCPLPLNCLTLAIAGDWMLHRRGIPSCLVIGVASDPDAGFRSHAWLVAGGHVVVGAFAPGEFREIWSRWS